MEKKWYEIVLNYWAQISVLLGTIGFVISTITKHFLKKQVIIFSSLQENKILEIKTFYKSYLELIIALSEFTFQNGFIDTDPETLKKMNEKISVNLKNFRLNVMIVRLFLPHDDIETIEEIDQMINSILKDLNAWNLYNKSSTKQSEAWDKLKDVLFDKLPNKLPDLIKKLEGSLRNSFNV